MFRILTISSILVCSCLLFPVISQAGTVGDANCLAEECQANRDDCLACSDGGTECWWTGTFDDVGDCRNPGACCYSDGAGLSCEVMNGLDCGLGLDGEWFEGSSCEEISCGGPVTIVPTMGQWGIILASIVLGTIGVIAIIRERNLKEHIS